MAQNILPPHLQEDYLRIIRGAQDIAAQRAKVENHPFDHFLTGTVMRIPILIWMGWMAHNIGIFLAGGQNTPFISYLVPFLLSVLFAKFFWEAKTVPWMIQRRSRLINELAAKNDSAMRIWWKDVAEVLQKKGWGVMTTPKGDTSTDCAQRVFGWNGELWAVQPFQHGKSVWLVNHRGDVVSSAHLPSSAPSRRNKDRI